MNALFEDLKDLVRRQDVLVIVGAGVSLAATRNAQVASWIGLLNHGIDRCVDVVSSLPDGWAERVRGEIGSGDMDDLLSAAEKIAAKLGAPEGGEYRRWLRETVGELRIADDAVLAAICGLNCPLATTNYDGLLEEFSVHPAVTWRDGPRVERVIRGDEQGVIHLHGHWRDPQSVVLGIRSYEDVLGNEHAQTMLAAVRATRTLLFVGFGAGLDDPNLGALLEWAEGVFAGSEYRHYRLLREAEVAEAANSPDQRLFAMSYGDHYDDLPGFLRSLAASIPSDPQPPPPDAPLDPSPDKPPDPGRLSVPVLDDLAMPADSPFYVERDADLLIYPALAASGATVTVMGHRKAGKSSLLARLHESAKSRGHASCWIDFLELEEFCGDTEQLFFEIAGTVRDRFNLAQEPGDDWSPRRGPRRNLTRYLERHVLAEMEGPVQLLLDEADLTFGHQETSAALFATLRYWHNRRANDPDGRWRRLDLVVSHATDPILWIPDLNQSPFNVGLQLRLDDFTAAQVDDLNRRYGQPLTNDAELQDLMKLVGGHPYLVRLSLYTMVTQELSFGQLKDRALDESGPFASHMHRLSRRLLANNELREALQAIANDGACNDELLFQRLWAAGLVRGESRERVEIRYKLYQDYFEQRIFPKP